MIKHPIPIIILLVIPFFIIPVNAMVTIDDFEDGTIYGDYPWTTPSGFPSFSSIYAYLSINGTLFHASAGTPEQSSYYYIYKDVDMTGHNTLSFWANERYIGSDAGGWGGYITLSVEDAGSWSFNYLDTPSQVWENHEIDVSGVTGNKEVRIGWKAVWGNTGCWIDEIYLDYDSSVNSINYNPDIPITNTKPFNLSYTLNTTYSENPLYPCFIYSWVGTDIGNETHPNIIWGSNYEGYVNQASGNFITSDYFHSYQWPDLNISYGIVLYNPDGMTSGIRFDNIESDNNMLDYDQIYVNYSYNKTPPSPPSPMPTPNMTAIPTPSGTPTPQPTATPQPNPESINESLNTSFKQGYSNLVNTTIDGFYEPVYNFTYYIASPLLGINDTLYNFSIHMNESFTNSSSSLILSSSILFLIMTNIPDKLINVMTYYLIWLIILLIFKGDA